MDNFMQPYISKDERACPYCNLILSQYELRTRQCYYCQTDLPQEL